MTRAVVGVALCLWILWCGLPARAQEAALSTRARMAYLEADFAGARALAERAVADAGTSVEDLVLAHRVLAVLDALEQRPEPAAHIALALALDPSAVAPDGAPLAVTEEFARVRAERSGRAARLGLASAPGESLVAVASVEDAPPGLVGSIALMCVVQGRELRREARATRVSLELPASGARCRASARSVAGALLWSREADVSAAPALAEPTPAESDTDPDDTPLVVGVTLGAIGAAALIAGGVALGVVLGGQSTATFQAPRVAEW